jgi:hypothetical protein
MFLTTTHSSLAESDGFDHDSFQPCGIGRFGPRRILAMLNQTVLTTTHTSHTESDGFNHKHPIDADSDVL